MIWYHKKHRKTYLQKVQYKGNYRRKRETFGGERKSELKKQRMKGREKEIELPRE